MQLTQESYQLKITGFEGPLGLLLSLVEKRQLFINDVSLAAVTEDYLNYLNKLGGLNPAEISNFVLVASTLILIKSKSLLPDLNLTSEEESDIRNLEEKLRLYEIFSKLSVNIKNDFGRKIIFAPLERKNDFLMFLPDKEITKEKMMSFAKSVLDSMPKKIFLPEVAVQKVISLEEMIGNLTDRIKNSMKMSFKDFAGKAVTREEKIFVIVGFLAMLELVRNVVLEALQEYDGGDIIIEKQISN